MAISTLSVTSLYQEKIAEPAAPFVARAKVIEYRLLVTCAASMNRGAQKANSYHFYLLHPPPNERSRLWRHGNAGAAAEGGQHFAQLFLKIRGFGQRQVPAHELGAKSGGEFVITESRP